MSLDPGSQGTQSITCSNLYSFAARPPLLPSPLGHRTVPAANRALHPWDSPFPSQGPPSLHRACPYCAGLAHHRPADPTANQTGKTTSFVPLSKAPLVLGHVRVRVSHVMGRSGPWLFCTINVNRENGKCCEDLVEDLRRRRLDVQQNVCALTLQETTGR